LSSYTSLPIYDNTQSSFLESSLCNNPALSRSVYGLAYALGRQSDALTHSLSPLAAAKENNRIADLRLFYGLPAIFMERTRTEDHENSAKKTPLGRSSKIPRN
jgi:hypothetical protein